MSEKTYGIILGILNIVLLVVCGVFFLGKDKNAPEILLSNVNFVYAAEAEDDALFQGVTAFDEEDGELTGSVVIEKIVTDVEKETATITYGVADSAGNVGKVTCTVAMDVTELEEVPEQGELEGIPENQENGEENSQETDTEGEDAEPEESENGGSEEDAATGDSEDEGEGNAEDAGNPGDGDEDSAEGSGSGERDGEALPTAGEAANRTQTVTSRQNPGRPAIVFRSQAVKVKAGQSPAWVNVIEGLHDDKDNYETLYKSLKVNGDYDRNTAGTYDVTVTITDGDGNESNAYPVKIVVEAWE